MLVHVDQAGCHCFTSTIDFKRTVNLNRISRYLRDHIALDQNIGVHDQIGIKPVEHVNIGEQDGWLSVIFLRHASLGRERQYDAGDCASEKIAVFHVILPDRHFVPQDRCPT